MWGEAAPHLHQNSEFHASHLHQNDFSCFFCELLICFGCVYFCKKCCCDSKNEIQQPPPQHVNVHQEQANNPYQQPPYGASQQRPYQQQPYGSFPKTNIQQNQQFPQQFPHQQQGYGWKLPL